MKRYCLNLIWISWLVILLSGCNSSVIEEQGVRLPEYQRIQPTATVVLIHGMYLTPDVWLQWETYFQELGYTVYSPAWPLHELTVDQLNSLHPDQALGDLRFEQLVAHYKEYISNFDEPPILIGHSMGGLITQRLLIDAQSDHLINVAAGVAINSAPPFGVVSGKPNFLKANWPHLNPFQDISIPSQLTFQEFQFGFVNGMDIEEQRSTYMQYVVPESRRVGRASLTLTSKLNSESERAPLLIISGGKDNTIPASLNYSNFKKSQLKNG